MPESPLIPADPFAYWPDRRSRAAGLGGAEPGDDPDYVFHTAYHELPEGTVRARLRFDGLLADEGALTLRVNALGPDGRAATVRHWALRLGGLRRDGGEAAVEFEAAAGRRYAVLGHVHDGATLAADALAVELEPVAASPHARELERARGAMPARPVIRRARRLASDAPATLADPVSQTCTAAQFAEPAFRLWAARLGLSGAMHRKQWEFAYVLRVLERYGALRSGARGLGFGVGREPVAAMLAASGCEVVATDLPPGDERAAVWEGAGLDALRRPAICPDDLFDERVTWRAVDMNRVPGDLNGFDFTWSSCALEHLGSIEAGLRFVRRSVECLAPGGLAVHTTEFNCTSDDDTVDHGDTVLFRRRDLDRLAVELVARGHGVAQLKYDLGDLPEDAEVDAPPFAEDGHLKLALGRYVSTSFGMVVTRGER